GAVSSIDTVVPAFAVGLVCDWIQNVSPRPLSTHWCTIDWPLPTVRAAAPSQSLPTPNTQPPSPVVVTVVRGAPLAPFAVLEAPTPPAPANAMTCSDWS